MKNGKMEINLFYTNVVLHILLISSLVEESTSCFGASACLGGCGAPSVAPYSAAAAARTRALAAPSHGGKGDQQELRTNREQCAHFGVYRASELRSQASIYNFAMGAPRMTVDEGGLLTCRFDTPDEPCAWYAVDLERDSFHPQSTSLTRTIIESAKIPFTFQRARFESIFDLLKFDCTSEWIFPFDNFFLIAGGQRNGLSEMSAAIEAKIPCQSQKAVLKFNYWSNNETPVLKICVLIEENLSPQCEEAKLDTNPLSFEIPQSTSPFRLRILVENIGEEDIVFIDGITYQGTICKGPTSQLPSRSHSVGDEKESTHLMHRENPQDRNDQETQFYNYEDNFLLNDSTFTRDGSLGFVIAPPHEDLNLLKGEKQKKILEPYKDKQFVPNMLRRKDGNNKKPQTSLHENILSACEALECDFNFGNSCHYNLAGLGATSDWKLSDVAVGNPHTGIHRANPNDARHSGFAYVGVKADDFNDEVFVMESAKFALQKPAFLVFDFFQRSLGPELRVCVNGFASCPYANPPLKTTRHWHLNQRLLLNSTAVRVYFIAAKVRQNQYIGIDNIKLKNLDDSEECV